MGRSGFWVAILILGMVCGCARTADQEEALTALLMEQQDAWNRGDVEAFMDGYVRSDALRFVSSSGEIRGWQPTLERYLRTYPDRAAMGTLTFEVHEIRLLSARYAFVFGGYALMRESDQPTGLFTLLAERTPEGWRIVHDHTSKLEE